MSEFQNNAVKVQAKNKGTQRKAIGKIADMLERNGIDLDEIGTISKVSVYQSITKNDEGEAEHHDLYGVQINPAWEEGPKWELPRQGPPQPVHVFFSKRIVMLMV